MSHWYFFADVLWVEARTTPLTVPSPTVAVSAAKKAGSMPAGSIHASVEQERAWFAYKVMKALTKKRARAVSCLVVSTATGTISKL